MNDNVQTQAFDGMVLLLEGTALQGPPGEQGEGVKGQPGDSTYQTWLKEGNTGSEEDFLEAQKGPQGEQGVSLTNRGEWSPDVYGPGDYVFAEGSTNDRSMWIVSVQESFISQVPPNQELDKWIEFSSQQGEPGIDGSIWYIRTTTPDPGLGKTTDCWLNVNTGDVWQKTDVWGSPIGTLAGGGSGGGVSSVNEKTPDSNGNVTLLPTDIGAATTAQGAKADSAVQPDVLDAAVDGIVDALKPVALSGDYNDLTNKPTLGSAAAANSSAFATAAQGAKADSAVQPGALAAVATSGAYNDLSGKPTLGSAAAQNSSAFATATQGAKADSAVQPNQLAAVAVSGNYNDLSNKPSLGSAASQPSTAFATAAQGAKADTAVQPGGLAAVATSGQYADLLGKPTIPAAKGKNVLINGNFDIWQRRDTYTQNTNGQGYCADRWVIAAANCSHQVQRNVNIPGDGPHPMVTNFHRSNVTGAGSTSSAYVSQYIENVQTLADRDAVVSFYMYGPSYGAKVGVRLLQSFGSGGSAVVVKELGVFQLPTSGWAKVELTGKLASLVGKTVGAGNSLYLVIDLCGPSNVYGGALTGQTGVFGLTRVQLEEGTVATTYEDRPIAQELSLCERYYEKSYDMGVFPGNISAASRCGEFLAVTRSGAASALITRFRTRKRTTPFVNIYSSESGVLNSFAQDNGTDLPINGVSAVGDGSFQLSYTNGSGRYGCSFHYTADSEF